MADNGLVTVKSSHRVKDTIDRLAAIVAAKGMEVFARLDHGKGASDVGLPLRPTELLIFGNAKGGTPLMQQNQAIGIDLPLKARWPTRTPTAPSGSATTTRLGLRRGTELRPPRSPRTLQRHWPP
jgi:hypothetical protein